MLHVSIPFLATKNMIGKKAKGVVVSRAKTLEGLKVVSFPQSAQLEANEEVKKFLRTKMSSHHLVTSA